MTTKPSVDFNFDTYKAEAGEPFAFVHRGKRHEIKPLTELPGLTFFENALRGDAYATLEILKQALPEDIYDDLREAPLSHITAFMEAYTAHAGLTPEGN